MAIIFLLAATLSQAADVTLFAAASTTNALSAVGAAFNAKGQDKLRLVFASTSTLARQIANGAPADLFLAANEQWMDYLNRHNAIENDSRIDLLQNRLVLIAPKNRPFAPEIKLGKIKPGFPLAAALGNSRLAMGDPGHVPAGIYAKTALEKLGVWQDVAKKTAFAGDVRAALALVDRGEAAAGIVYATDAAISDQVRVVGEFPIDSYPAIAYPLAIIEGRRNEAVEAVYDFLRGPEAQAIFRDQGFGIPAQVNPVQGN